MLSRASALVDEDATNAGTAASMVAQHIQAHFAVSRVTLWALQVQDEQRVLKRMGGFDGAAQQALVEPVVLRESDLGPLFDVLVADSVYACEDTNADPRLEPLRLTRLIPDDIRASMTAPVSVNGVVVGIVSCTERGETRRWSRQETAALRRVADEIALRHVPRETFGGRPSTSCRGSRLQKRGGARFGAFCRSTAVEEERDLEAANQAWFTYVNPTLGADDHFHRTSSTGRCGSSLSMRLPRRESRAFARTFARLPSTLSISRCRAARALSASRFSRSASGPCPVAVIRLFRR